MLVILLLIVGAVSLILVYLWRWFKLPNLFHIGVEPWGNRTIIWIRTLGTSGVEDSGARFSDFVGLAGFSLSILAIILGWYSIVHQTKKAALEQEMRDLTNKITDKQKLIEATSVRLEQNKSAELMHLGAPRRDAEIIGNHVDLDWSYADHSPFITYLVEVRNKEQSKPEFKPGVGVPCELNAYRACRFVATDPNGQHAQIFGSDLATLSGDYLWRVAPARRTIKPLENYESDRIADWSQFRAFTIYPTIKDRILRTGKVLVGTTYAEDLRFSRLGSQGKPEGHDIDLIRILVEGCLSIKGDGKVIRFDRTECERAVTRYQGNRRYVRPQPSDGIQVIVKPYPSVSAGLNALGRREVDLFIGSLTKARKRERGPVLFTDGYYSFETKLYSKAELGAADLSVWASKKRTIGCINNSSNYWLATLLAAEDKFRNQLTIVTFDTFPEMESAFDRGEVDGILLDDVLENELREAVAIDGLQKTAAWNRYHEDTSNLGFPNEQFAIAVVRDVSEGQSENSNSLFGWFENLFKTPEEQLVGDNFLFGQLQSALRSDEVQKTLLPTLRSVYKIPSRPAP